MNTQRKAVDGLEIQTPKPVYGPGNGPITATCTLVPVHPECVIASDKGIHSYAHTLEKAGGLGALKQLWSAFSAVTADKTNPLSWRN